MKAALLQLNSSDDPKKNLDATLALVDGALAQGAELILTPEVTNCVSANRRHQADVLQLEQDDITLAALRSVACNAKVWIVIGSLALKTNDPDGRFANRSFVIDPDGNIKARYDKIHMFDVSISGSESYRESAGYRPGNQAVICQTDVGMIGLTICYDLRFPHLYRDLAYSGAQIISVPSAFSVTTGHAHWEALLRARAIETGCYVLAPAQHGEHCCKNGRPRTTYGHTLAVAPWGELLTLLAEGTGFCMVDINLGDVDRARARVPSLYKQQRYSGPEHE
ncbi:MAG: carbon-nitrogen hydrolase family protein [Rhodobacteraceae bacterium]|nr:carbon-nitrogen hydrolase family protein [Paracoccaceae bacterium]RZO41490.1 MAG: carbon-nitrogen hydrolase family protein [Paracoccaceae bacterium]